MIQYDDLTQLDTSPISTAEYQLFIDDQMAAGYTVRPDHWPDSQFILGTGKLPILGIRAYDALQFCEWLTKRRRDIYRYRLPTTHEFSFLLAGHYFQANQTADMGVWLDDGKSFDFAVGERPAADQVLSKARSMLLANQIPVDLSEVEAAATRILAVDVEQAWSEVQSIDIPHLLDPVINHASILQSARYYDHSYAHSLLVSAKQKKVELSNYSEALSRAIAPLIDWANTESLETVVIRCCWVIALLAGFKNVETEGQFGISGGYRKCMNLLVTLLWLWLRTQDDARAWEGIVVARQLINPMSS